MVGARSTERMCFCKQGRDPCGPLRPELGEISTVSITIASGGDRVKEIQLYYTY